MENQTPAIRKIIRWRAVREVTCLSRTTIENLEAAGDFPRRLQLGPRAVGWYQDEIVNWIESRQRKAG